MRTMPLILTPPNLAVHRRTIQLFIPDLDKEKVLLVHEKGDEEVGIEKPGVKEKKPAGSSLPGGGVDENKSEQALVERILKSLLPQYRISETFFKGMPYNVEIGLKLYLTAVTEGIEETGLLVNPTRILFEDHNSSEHNGEHKVIVSLGQVIAGSISKRSIETDDCGWFDLCGLPWDTYRSHVWRIIRALKVLGHEDLAAKVTVQEKPKEEKKLEAV